VGIEQAIDDQIVFVLGPAKEGACIVVDGADARIGVRFFGMALLSDQKNDRVDLDGIDPPGSCAHSCRNVVAGSGSDDSNVV